MIRMAKAPVLPAYIKGANSLLFQCLCMTHPKVKTAMLPREMLNKADKNHSGPPGANPSLSNGCNGSRTTSP